MTGFDPTLADIAEMAISWRRDFHAHPEVGFKEVRTAARIAELVRSFGVDEIETGIAGTGVAARIRGRFQGDGPRIGLRADMDALPIAENGNAPYRSTMIGQMHACGHDGHMAMLLGATRYLCETRDFAGEIVVIFQPAEESGHCGAREMIRAGVLERFPVDEIYALHTLPGRPVGEISLRPGPVMSAFDSFDIEIEGRGAHASKPQQSRDPIVTGAHLITALQTLVSRSVDPLEMAVVSVCELGAGTVNNAIPETARLSGSVRTYKKVVQDVVEERMRDIARGFEISFGVHIDVRYSRVQPPTVNAAAQVQKATRALEERGITVNLALPPSSGAEDFAFFLQERPGAFLRIGNGDSAALHNPAFDFNDRALAAGIGALVAIAEASGDAGPSAVRSADPR
ncbi:MULTISPECIES: amidohydrolase [unclassified Roseitalea]|uniref:amidohydrolase n=1 Tax=unclassified Roseitalea TaxID=2639107 RepID=UPI00273FC586|nr:MULTISPECIES: amidohydrolase [unclassified Roseitalea]